MSSGPVTQAPTPPAGGIEERFQNLETTWHQAVAHQSASTIRYGHPAYREIIALGEPVVPLLLRDLEVNGRHWFAALKAITGEDPVPAADAGRVGRMAEAWLAW